MSVAYLCSLKPSHPWLPPMLQLWFPFNIVHSLVFCPMHALADGCSSDHHSFNLSPAATPLCLAHLPPWAGCTCIPHMDQAARLMEKDPASSSRLVSMLCSLENSVGEVRSRTDWDPVWTGPNPAVPVQVWDFPENTGPLGLRSGHSHIARDRLRPGLDRDCINLYKQYANILFLLH